jgi:hypothetical protein
VAGAMVGFLKSVCREKGFIKMFVVASADNEAALRLYDSQFGADGKREASIVFTHSAHRSDSQPS